MASRSSFRIPLLGWLGVMLATAPQVPAQQPLSLAVALHRLAAQAAALEHSLPSLTCMESAISQERRHDMVLRSVDFTASLSARRNPDESITESRDYRTLRGQPFTGGGFVMPMYVTGGFSRAMRYFSADQQPCYQYTLRGNRIDFTTAAHPPEGCRTRGTNGYALIDDEGNITHMERTVSGHWAADYNQVPHAIIDFAALTLNNTSYRITKHLLADQANRGSIDYFEADYTACRLFSATITLGPAVEAPNTRPDTTPAPK
jgi:hypothetical protein